MKTAPTDISKLLTRLKTDLVAMKDNATIPKKIFQSVTALVWKPKAKNTPFCGIFLEGDPDDDFNNIGCFTDYRFKISVGLKGTDEEKIIDEICYVRAKIKSFFQNDPDYSSVVDGFTQILVESNGIRDETPEGLSGVMIWNTGLIIVVQVERQIKGVL